MPPDVARHQRHAVGYFSSATAMELFDNDVGMSIMPPSDGAGCSTQVGVEECVLEMMEAFKTRQAGMGSQYNWS